MSEAMRAVKSKKPSVRRSPKRRNSRLAKIDEVMGKYAYVRTSSEEFALEKQRDIERENRRR